MPEITHITVKHTGPQSSLIHVTWQTPEWAQAIQNSGGFIVKTLWLAGSTLLAIAAYEGLFHLPAGKTIVATAIASLLLFWLVWNANAIVQQRRHQRGLVRDNLKIKITPEHITAHGYGVDFYLPRDEEILFTAQPHRHGKYEEREEQRVGRRLGHTYRDAFEVWMQAGHRFIRIAATSNEQSARAIARHCQQADERATRGQDQQDAMSRRFEPV